jgi:tetratricopeptide (TPR) repeat protein
VKTHEKLSYLGFFLAMIFLCVGPALQAQESENSVADQVQADIQAGHLDAALDKAQIAVGQYPHSSDLQQLLGIALFKKGLNQDALLAFRRAIECDPSVPQNYFDVALVDLADNRYPDAAKNLETSTRLDPTNAEAHLLLGRAYHNQNQTLPAIAQFQQALALNSTLPLAHYHLGFAYQSLGKLEAALAEYNQEIQINPRYPDVRWLAGNIELKHGNLAAAKKLFREGVELKPQAFEPHYGLGQVDIAEKHFEEAEEELLTALRCNPHRVEVHFTLARAYQQLGKKEAAEHEFHICATMHAQEENRSGIAGATSHP